MSTAPVTLDFSKAQPVATPQASPDGGGVSLDFSKAQPLQPEQSGKAGMSAALDNPDIQDLGHGDQAAGVAASAEGVKGLVQGGVSLAKAGVKALTTPGIPEGAVAEELAGGLKILRDSTTGQFVKAAPTMVGKIPGILKSAYDWASANPVKAYAIYKIADEAGIGVSGLKKVFHLFSGAEE